MAGAGLMAPAPAASSVPHMCPWSQATSPFSSQSKAHAPSGSSQQRRAASADARPPASARSAASCARKTPGLGAGSAPAAASKASRELVKPSAARGPGAGWDHWASCGAAAQGCALPAKRGAGGASAGPAVWGSPALGQPRCPPSGRRLPEAVVSRAACCGWKLSLLTVAPEQGLPAWSASAGAGACLTFFKPLLTSPGSCANGHDLPAEQAPTQKAGHSLVYRRSGRCRSSSSLWAKLHLVPLRHLPPVKYWHMRVLKNQFRGSVGFSGIWEVASPLLWAGTSGSSLPSAWSSSVRRGSPHKPVSDMCRKHPASPWRRPPEI
mmetsp:Transcript_78651/g.217448  ORF Transcript_78651/g.217448 Transcript_78651/m.217448 type:complete len:323 (+) Transcript_78651:185-1153(+)